MQELCSFCEKYHANGGLRIRPRHLLKRTNRSIRHGSGSLLQRRISPEIFFTK